VILWSFTAGVFVICREITSELILCTCLNAINVIRPCLHRREGVWRLAGGARRGKPTLGCERVWMVGSGAADGRAPVPLRLYRRRTTSAD